MASIEQAMTSSAVYCLTVAPLKTWTSAPLGVESHRPLTFPDRNAVPSRALRCRWDVWVTEPR
jgi:hypothetical protein